ncbi:S41 family peptidase [Flaviramulus sp. BrNp1-15]|uniref:S41 family peptidase n=1 Tax=Flaviramulus sp. BrNp1-15 TaxID=2916754 RepID=UPI001EE96F5E|nr:S41 family peptidase [Flaviramulus sp. BrNp1-15]ULC58528.1 S41 family peptidase [Flaviramulus sp. BrNp1-15]
MKKLFLVISALTILSSCTSVKKYNEQITSLHAVEDLHKDVDKVYKQLKKHHPKLYQYTSKEVLDFKFDSLKKSINTPIDSRDFFKKLAPVVTHVRQGHVSVSSVGRWFKKKERKALNKQKFEFYDLDFEYLEGKLWVKNNIGKDSTIIGNEVLKINDESAVNLVNTYKTRFASDGYNTTLHNRFVGKGFSTFYYKDKGFIDSLKVTFKSKDSIFTKTFRRISKEKKNKVDSVSVKKVKPKKLSKGEKQTRRLARKKRKKDNKKYGYLNKRKQYTRNFNFIGKDSSVAFMKIRGFTNGNYKKFYKESFAKLDSAKSKYLVLDLRDNGGGRIAEIDYLYSYLANEPYQFITESEVKTRMPFLKSFMSNTTPNSLKVVGALLSPLVISHNLLKTKKREGKLYYRFNKHSKIKEHNPLHFKGKIYVLINGNSFSASSLISTHLKATERAVFVGEETGGAYNGTVAGIYKIYQLPTSKLKIRMGLMQIEAPQKQNPDGYGVKPDIKIEPTVEDRRLKKDTELEWILADIEKNEG